MLRGRILAVNVYTNNFFKKFSKKVLTKEKRCGKIDELSARGQDLGKNF